MPKTQLRPALTFLAVLAVVLVVLVPFRAQTREGTAATSGTRVGAPAIGATSSAPAASSRRASSTTTATSRTTSARTAATSGGLFGVWDRAAADSGRSRATGSNTQRRRPSETRRSASDGGDWALQQALERLDAGLRRH